MSTQSDTVAEPDQKQAPVLSHQEILTILGGLMAGMFLAALDQTVVSTAIRTIADDLNGISLQAWVTTAYLITSTIATPLYGKLSDIYGRRPFFMLAISLFVIGSLACTFATSMYQLAAFRAFQGLGAGGLFSLALAIMADILPPRERAKYQGYFMAVFGTSSVLGPLIGGLFAGAGEILGIAGWRWVFLINVPIGIVALIIVFRVLHIPHTPNNHRIDWWGATALIIGLVPLLIAAEQGREWGWGSGRVLTMIAVGIVGIAAFILIEIKMKSEALIPMRLFRNRNFSLLQGGSVLVGMAMFGAILTIPLYLQIVRGASPTGSGLQMLSMTIGLMIAAMGSAQLTARTGKYKIFPLIGLALVTIGALLLGTFLRVDTPDLALWGMIFLIGFGIGLCMQTLTLATQNSVPATDMGVATSASTFFRQTGGTIGVAVFLSMVFSSLPDKIGGQLKAAQTDPAFLDAAAQQAGSSDPAAIQKVVQGFGAQMESDTSFLQKVPTALAHPFQQGFVESMQPVFFVAAGIAIVCWLIMSFVTETPLRTRSALQERMDDAQAAADAAEPKDSASADTIGAASATGTVGATVSDDILDGELMDVSEGGTHEATDPDLPIAKRLPGVTEDAVGAGEHGRHQKS